jgi:metal-responsive CopG/Arc/MetJ family transcriptional regulator
MMPNKRIILNLDEDLVTQIDSDVELKGMPSRNSYIEQILRKHLGWENVFESEESD